MGTFSSETAANIHNSDKFETLKALHNDLIWLLQHSWFFNFFTGNDPTTPLQEVHVEKLHLFSNHTSAPRKKLC